MTEASPPDAVYAVEIDAPIRRVWDEITRSGAQHPPMFGCFLRSDLEPGSDLRWTDKGEKRVMVFGQVLEKEPPTRLVHTFAFSWFDEEPTTVEWRLEEAGADRTRVTVTHRGLPDGSKTRKAVGQGWPTILRRYKDLIEKGRLPAGDRFKLGLMSAMSFMMPKSTLKENVEPRLRQAARTPAP